MKLQLQTPSEKELQFCDCGMFNNLMATIFYSYICNIVYFYY